MPKKTTEEQKTRILEQLKAIGIVPKDRKKAIKGRFYSSVSGRFKRRIEIKD
jgi:hypothetical protein